MMFVTKIVVVVTKLVILASKMRYGFRFLNTCAIIEGIVCCTPTRRKERFLCLGAVLKIGELGIRQLNQNRTKSNKLWAISNLEQGAIATFRPWLSKNIA